MSTTFILIGTPCYGGLVTHVYLQSILKLMMAPRPGVRLGLITAAHDSLITRARNTIVANFLDTPDATHLLFIDADIGFEPDEVYRLLALGEDLVAGRYPVKARDWAKIREVARTGPADVKLESAALEYVGQPCDVAEIEARSGFCTGTYAGTGFMLIRRAVLERLIAAHPETKYRSIQTFPRPKSVTGAYLSEDFTFCKRWRDLGGRLWLDTQSRLTHVGSQEFHGEPLVKMP